MPSVVGKITKGAVFSGIVNAEDIDGTTTDLTCRNSGLHVLDTNASHDLIITPGSDLSADRILTLTTGDAARGLTLSGDATISGTNTGDQSLSGYALVNQTMYIGTTSVAINRSSAALVLTGITSIDGSSASCSGNAATVTHATLTTALTVNTGTLTLTANVANSSVLTIGAGAVSVSGSNTGDQSLAGLVPYTGATADLDLGTHYLDVGQYIYGNNATELTVTAKSATAGNTAGANLLFHGGSGYGSGTGGYLYFYGGDGGATGNGGDFYFYGGTGGATSGNGGNLYLVGGPAVSGDSNGGDVRFYGGPKYGAGTVGKFKFYDVTSDFYGVLDFSTILANRTYTFPNTTGTLLSTAVPVTATGTQLNYLNAATGTTGTTNTNLVFSTSPTLVTPVLGAATGTSLTVSGAHEDYKFGNDAWHCYLQGQASGTGSYFYQYAKDGDGTDVVGSVIYRKGIPGDEGINREALWLISTLVSPYPFTIFTDAAGTGTVCPLVLYTGSNANQLYLQTDGKVGIGKIPTAVLDVSGAIIGTSLNGLVLSAVDANGTICLGTGAGNLDIGLYNIFEGYQAGYNNDTTGGANRGTYNTYIGYKTGYGATASTTNTGYYNVFLGATAGYKNTSGNYNFFVGYGAGYSNTSGSGNFFSGTFNSYANTTGGNNCCVGTNTNRYNSTGANNTIIGTNAGYNTTASSNVFVGYKAGYRQTSNSNLLIIDNQDRTTVALEATNSLIYGVFAADPVNQILTFNAKIATPVTITTPGTTGNQTINKPSGRVNIAAAGTTVTVTNSLVTADSIVLAVAATADATARVTNVVPAAGSFVINTVACTGETAFNFFVLN